MPKRFVFILAMSIALMPCAVRAGAPQTAQKPPAAHQREAAPKQVVKGGTQASASDAQIEATIRAKLAKSKIGADGFKVRVQGGVATFEGKTEVIQHKGAATRMAKASGAVAVNNHIEISDAARQKASGNLEEGRRRAQIKRGDARSEGTTKSGR